MKIRYCGGPYDALWLDDYEVSEGTALFPIRTRGGRVRVFSLLPRDAGWPAAVAGVRARAALVGRHPYELHRIGRGGVEFRDAGADGAFDRALRRAGRPADAAAAGRAQSEGRE